MLRVDDLVDVIDMRERGLWSYERIGKWLNLTPEVAAERYKWAVKWVKDCNAHLVGKRPPADVEYEALKAEMAKHTAALEAHRLKDNERSRVRYAKRKHLKRLVLNPS